MSCGPVRRGAGGNPGTGGVEYCDGSATPVLAATCAPVATATAVARAQTFADVPLTHPYYPYVQALYQAGYTAGIAPQCASEPMQFCANAPLNRDVAAYMLARAKNLTLP